MCVDLIYAARFPAPSRGGRVTVQDVFEAVGNTRSRNVRCRLETLETECLPVGGRLWCAVHANTMATVSEAIGLALPYSAGAPCAYGIRDAL